MKPSRKPKPLTRAEYVTLAKSTDPGDLSYPKDPRFALLELRDRGYDTEHCADHVITRCHELGLIPNAYILWDHDIDAVAAYCDKHKLYSDLLIGCRYLDLNFWSYKKAEREMRRIGADARQAVILAMPRAKGGRRITMMAFRTVKKKRNAV